MTHPEPQTGRADSGEANGPAGQADAFLALTRQIAVVAGGLSLSLSFYLAGLPGLFAALTGWAVAGASFRFLVRGLQAAVETFRPGAPVKSRALFGLLTRQFFIAAILFVLLALLKASVLATLLGISAWPLACLMAAGVSVGRESRLAAPVSSGRS